MAGMALPRAHGLAHRRLEPLVVRAFWPQPSPYTYTGTQTYLVGDARGGGDRPRPGGAEHLERPAAAIGDARGHGHHACTHTHRDHSPAAAPLPRSPARRSSAARR
jgi:hypothetical protein